MQHRNETIKYLLEQYTNGTATADEKEALMKWFEETGDHSAMEGFVKEAWNGAKEVPEHEDVNWKEIFDSAIAADKPIIRTIRKKAWVYRAAAAIVLLCSLLAYYTVKKTPATQLADQPEQFDVQPPSNSRAYITLSNGQKVFLNDAETGSIAAQGKVDLIKSGDGKIVYSGNTSEILFNELHNPRGSQTVDITLSDGSRVWLNAGSSIRYPVTFNDKERVVCIDGEAFFHVAHNASAPFKVLKKQMEILVLGTQFNVNTYENEGPARITLIEGSVEVDNGNSKERLRPGQQARMTENIVVENGINTEEVIAWKNGRFIFGEKASIQAIMRQLERWYDVDVEFQGDITAHFGGSISKQVNVSEVLKILEATGKIKFKINQKTITIMP